MLRCPSLPSYILIIPCTIFLSSCVFSSDEEYFKDVAEPDPAAVSAHINSVGLADYNPGDTIDVFGSTAFDFSLKGTHGAVESATVFLDGKHVSSTNGSIFTIGISQLKNGIFPLQLDMIMDSGTGSLADAVGSEKMKVTMKWIVRVDVSIPPQPVPTLDIIDGFLTLQWPAYSRPNFQSYIVKRILPSGASKSFEIENKQIVSWRDSSYVGGHTTPITYSLSIVTEPGTTTSIPISRIDPMDNSFSFNPLDSTFTLKWKPTKFYGTFNGYKVGLENAGHVTVLTDINDSTYTNKFSTIRFGGDSFVGIVVQSRSEDIPDFWKWNSCKLGTPLSFTPVGNIVFNSYLNSFVALDADKKLLKLNEQLEPVGTIATLRSTKWRMPYPGNYIYTADDRIDNNIYRLNLGDNSEVFFEYFYLSYPKSNTVASNGLICIDYDRRPVGPPANIPAQYLTGVLDAADESYNYVFHEHSSTTRLSAVISEDGKFIWANDNRVFEISGSTSALVGSFTPSGSFIQFRPDNSNEIMFHDDHKINFYDAKTFALIRTISPPVSSVYWNDLLYDVQTKTMLWKSLGTSPLIYTVNIETGVAKSIQISTKASSADLYMLGDLLIHKGTYIRVN
jgi:hypothetical protein